MKCPDGWTFLDDARWIWRQEKVTEDRWILVFFNHTGDPDLMAGWFNIGKGPWRMDDEKIKEPGFWIRTDKVPHPASILEIECIAMEWRKDILEGRTHEAAP